MVRKPARTTPQDQRPIIRDPLYGNAQRMHRPALLEKGAASNDLRHACPLAGSGRHNFQRSNINNTPTEYGTTQAYRTDNRARSVEPRRASCSLYTNSYARIRAVKVSANTRLVLGQVYCPLITKFVVKKPLSSRMIGARTSLIVSEKSVCHPGRAWTGWDCEPDVTTRPRPASGPSRLKEQKRPPGQRGRFCRRAGAL